VDLVALFALVESAATGDFDADVGEKLYASP